MEHNFGTIGFMGKTYTLTGNAEHTNRLLPTANNYNNPEAMGGYWFEMSTPCVDDEGEKHTAYFEFWYEEEKELDSYDYDDGLTRVEEV